MGVTQQQPKDWKAKTRRDTLRHAVAVELVAHPGSSVRDLARALHLDPLRVKRVLEYWRDLSYANSVRATNPQGVVCLWTAEEGLVELVRSGAVVSHRTLAVAQGEVEPNPWVHPYRVKSTVSSRQAAPLDYASPFVQTARL